MFRLGKGEGRKGGEGMVLSSWNDCNDWDDGRGVGVSDRRTARNPRGGCIRLRRLAIRVICLCSAAEVN